METTPVETNTKVTKIGKNADSNIPTQFTVFELETIHQVINSRGSQGAGIKDLRLLSKVASKVKSYVPERMMPPKQEDQSEEGKKAQMEAIKTWQKSLEERVDQVIDVDFTSSDLFVIKNKVRAFGQYATDEDIRERLVVLFDKLDIQ